MFLEVTFLSPRVIYVGSFLPLSGQFSRLYYSKDTYLLTRDERLIFIGDISALTSLPTFSALQRYIRFDAHILFISRDL